MSKCKITKKAFLSAAAVMLAAGVSTFSVFAAKKTHQVKRGARALPNDFTITAHAGANNTAANTAESLEICFNTAADIVEFDLNYTADGEPVLSHNTPENDDCCSLREAFAVAAKHTDKKINVDVKSTEYLEKVPEIAKEFGLTDNIFFTGIELKDIDAVREKAPNIKYWLNYGIDKAQLDNDSYIAMLVDTVKEAGAIGLNIHHSNATEALVRALHENGLGISLWTVSTLPQMLLTISLSPDNITTIRPDDLADILKLLKN